MKSKTYNNGEVRSSEKDFETLQLGAFATPGLLLAQRLCRNARMAHTCHLERSERSCIFSYMRRKDFSPLARNDNCDTVSLRGRACPGLDPGTKEGVFFVVQSLHPLLPENPAVSQLSLQLHHLLLGH